MKRSSQAIMPTSQKTYCSYVSQKWVTVALCSLGSFSALAMRGCLSIVITDMVMPLNSAIKFSNDTCPDTNEVKEYRNESIKIIGRFDWDEHTQGLILSSFYGSYFITNLIGGMIADRFGGKHALGIGVLSAAVVTLLTPIIVEWGGAWALIFTRLLMGLGGGLLFPAINVLLAKWVPEDNRSFAATWAISGEVIGTACSTAVSGAIIRNSNLGWPGPFYFFGILGILSYVLNCLFCYSEPSDNPFISKKELKHLNEKLTNIHTDLPPMPWAKVLRSRPIWALLFANIGYSWCSFLIVSDMPKYLGDVLKYSIDDNGYLSSIPTVCNFISSCVTSWIADRLIAKNIVSTIIVRKVGCTISMLGPGIFFVAITYADCNGTLAMIFYTLGMTLLGFTNCSILVNALDLAPNYAGTLYGFVYGLTTIGGFFAPYIAGVMTPNQTFREWRYVFWIVFMILSFTNVVYLLYCSTDVQDWNHPDFEGKKERKLNEGIKEDLELLSVEREIDHYNCP